jgi:hypothetical protein
MYVYIYVIDYMVYLTLCLQVFHPERDIAGLKSGAKETEAYMAVTGVKVEPNRRQDGDQASSEEEDDDVSGDDDESGDGDDEKSAFKDSHRPRDESPTSKKVFFGFFNFIF